MKLEIDPSQFGHIASTVMGQAKQAADRAVLSAALRLVQLIVVEIIPTTRDARTGKGPPVDIGAYRMGWRAFPSGGGVEIENNAPHAMIIEYGAKAQNIKVGALMLQALAEWAVRKGLTNGTPGDERRIAWAIAQSMKKRGIFSSGEGLRVMERAMKRFPALLAEEFQREMMALQ